MRDLLSKVMTGSMIAGAALFVTACGGAEDATTNNAEVNLEDSLNTTDVTGVDAAANGTEANLGEAANVTTDTTVNTTTTTTTDTTANTADANGM